jgi:DNA topoisomerase-3
MLRGVIAVVAEKPSVARDIARVLGASERGQGYLKGRGFVVTWAIGHLVGLAEPHQIRPEWKRWSREQLPMLPESWPLVVLDSTKDQYDVVARVLNDPQVERVVCATDAGREGELIFRLAYEKAACRKPVSRLWISSLTEDAIRDGFSKLRDGRELDPLADAARGRSRADWLVGMNLSRACSLAFDETLPVGRVQTPTLAMLVERELAIRDFVPEDYLEVAATFAPEATGSYAGTWFRGAAPTPESKRLPKDGTEAQAIVARALAGRASIEKVRREQKRFPPPPLYDLTELQRHANRLYGFSAQQTLAFAQALYEQKKLLSYPRTDSRHLSTAVAATLPAVVQAIAAPYRSQLAPGTGQRPLGKRFVDDSKVTDHHAILPTTTSPEGVSLSDGERKVYDLVCRRLLMAWHDDHLAALTTVITRIDTPGVADRYHSTGTSVEQVGWKVLDVAPPRKKKGEDEEDVELPGGLRDGLPTKVLEAKALPKRTRPPRRLTDATLLTAMETAGRTLDDRELSDAMRERGLGTPATRAETIETLLRHGYAERQGKALAATEKGIRLIGRVHPHLKSPAMTAEWEAALARIQRGQEQLAPFQRRIEQFVRELVAATLGGAGSTVPARGTERDARPTFTAERREPAARPAPTASRAIPAIEPRPTAPATATPAVAIEPKPVARVTPAVATIEPRAAAPIAAPVDASRVGELLPRFGLTAFRPYQEAVCRAAAAGQDVLLVMPTGAGKSLCFQLPGLCRGGTTLVVSPLIALMEDQVAKLKAQGLRAERIHSGREREASREACRDYLAGRLDFLYIAPERLSVPGFPEFLARRTPALVAIDEAHCISHWGHDFRPDYRLIGGRLPGLRPAPVVAVTATATPRVQDDVASQLGLRAPGRFIHGFRRSNLAVEAVELESDARADLVCEVLRGPGRRPAIVYAPTRKETESLAELLAPEMPAAAYHAGLPSEQRERVQTAFLAGQVEVVVATIAFGMGVDKPDVRTVVHTGLPGSVEGYYQEIGRAGRDGAPSRALLLFSWADRRTHEFFHQRSYPEPEELQRLFDALGARPRTVDALARAVRLDAERCETALEKLWLHGGARVDREGAATRGEPGWRPAYEAQKEHRLEQLDAVLRMARGGRCRMLQFLEHFGDREDQAGPCGQCDVCAPAATLARGTRQPSAPEQRAARATLDALRARDQQALGPLFRDCAGALERGAYEGVIAGLERAGLIALEEDSFVKDGQPIRFRRARLTGAPVDLETLSIPGAPPREKAGKPSRRPRLAPAGKARPAARPAAPRAAARPREASKEAAAGLLAALTAWRGAEARHRGVPPFRIASNRVLKAIATARPRSAAELGALYGVGPRLVERHGRSLLALVASFPAPRQR